MKLTKTSWLLLAIGIFVITVGSLGAARSQRLSEGQKLSDELAVAMGRMSKLDLTELSARQGSLQEQIKQATQQLESARAALSQPNDSITISDSVFRIAATSGVEVTQMGSSSLTRSNLTSIGGSILPLVVLVRGDVPNLIDFVMRLNIELTTGVVKSAQITVPKASDNVTDTVTYDIVATITDNTTGNLIGNVSNKADDKMPSANIQIEVYSYKGS